MAGLSKTIGKALLDSNRLREGAASAARDAAEYKSILSSDASMSLIDKAGGLFNRVRNVFRSPPSYAKFDDALHVSSAKNLPPREQRLAEINNAREAQRSLLPDNAEELQDWQEKTQSHLRNGKRRSGFHSAGNYISTGPTGFLSVLVDPGKTISGTAKDLLKKSDGFVSTDDVYKNASSAYYEIHTPELQQRIARAQARREAGNTKERKFQATPFDSRSTAPIPAQSSSGTVVSNAVQQAADTAEDIHPTNLPAVIPGETPTPVPRVTDRKGTIKDPTSDTGAWGYLDSQNLSGDSAKIRGAASGEYRSRDYTGADNSFFGYLEAQGIRKVDNPIPFVSAEEMYAGAAEETAESTIKYIPTVANKYKEALRNKARRQAEQAEDTVENTDAAARSRIQKAQEQLEQMPALEPSSTTAPETPSKPAQTTKQDTGEEPDTGNPEAPGSGDTPATGDTPEPAPESAPPGDGNISSTNLPALVEGETPAPSRVDRNDTSRGTYAQRYSYNRALDMLADPKKFSAAQLKQAQANVTAFQQGKYSDMHLTYRDYIVGNRNTSIGVALGGSTLGFMALQLGNDKGALTNKQLYGQEDLY